MFVQLTITALLAASSAFAGYGCGNKGSACCWGKYCQHDLKCIEGKCGGMPPPPDNCGNGVVDDSEDCEPPDTDGCDSGCKFVPCPEAPECPDTPDCPPPDDCPPPPPSTECPPAEECPPPPGPPSCGDGIVQEGEECEPPGEGSCNDECKTGGPPPPPEPGCGNGIIDDGEDCEPPSVGGCNADCKIPPEPECGDNVVMPPEECEPPGAGSCNEECKITGPPPPEPEPSCGNGIVEDGEDCEPPSVGNCNANCQIPPQPECGDGVVQDGEACEPPNVGTCNENCQIPVPPPEPECGDGIVQDGEDCEPPGQGGCDEDCQFAPPPTPPQPPAGPCITCEDKGAGKPVQVTLQWDCDGPAPAQITGGPKKGGGAQYDPATGVVVFGSSGGKLGSQIDFNGESLHTSCSAPFYIGIRTFTESEDKKDQSCNSRGCWVVIDAVSEEGGVYCDQCPGNVQG